MQHRRQGFECSGKGAPSSPHGPQSSRKKDLGRRSDKSSDHKAGEVMDVEEESESGLPFYVLEGLQGEAAGSPKKTRTSESPHGWSGDDRTPSQSLEAVSPHSAFNREAASANGTCSPMTPLHRICSPSPNVHPLSNPSSKSSAQMRKVVSASTPSGHTIHIEKATSYTSVQSCVTAKRPSLNPLSADYEPPGEVHLPMSVTERMSGVQEESTAPTPTTSALRRTAIPAVLIAIASNAVLATCSLVGLSTELMALVSVVVALLSAALIVASLHSALAPLVQFLHSLRTVTDEPAGMGGLPTILKGYASSRSEEIVTVVKVMKRLTHEMIVHNVADPPQVVSMEASTLIHPSPMTPDLDLISTEGSIHGSGSVHSLHGTNSGRRRPGSADSDTSTLTGGGLYWSAGMRVAALRKSNHKPRSDVRQATVLVASMGIGGAFQNADAFVARHGAMLQVVCDAVIAGSGSLHVFLGEKVVASWNTCRASMYHAVAAASTSISIVHEIDRIEPPWEAPLPGLRVTLGITSGKVLAGIMGYEGWKNFTFIGQVTANSFHLQRLAETLHMKILVDSEVHHKNIDSCKLRFADSILYPNEVKPEVVYELLPVIKKNEEWIYSHVGSDYDEGAAALLKGRFDQAVGYLASALRDDPEDYNTLRLQELALQRKPPPYTRIV